MIRKVDGFKNKYEVIDPTSKEEFELFLREHANGLKCVISNSYTASRFGIVPGEKYCTINKKIQDNEFFLNGVF